MSDTYFDTYIRALGQVADRRGVLGQEWVVHPPNPDYRYETTPRNALTFGAMGVDGVHYAILMIDGAVRDESPVIQICPMDFDAPYEVLGETFLAFLATGCGVPREDMEAIFAAERNGEQSLVPVLKQHFDMSRLWGRVRPPGEQDLLDLIEKP